MRWALCKGIVWASLILRTDIWNSLQVTGGQALDLRRPPASSAHVCSPLLTAYQSLAPASRPPLGVFAAQWWVSNAPVMSCYCARWCIWASLMSSAHCKKNVSLIARSMAHRRSRGGRCWVLSQASKLLNAFTASGVHTVRTPPGKKQHESQSFVLFKVKWSKNEPWQTLHLANTFF